MEKVHFCTQCGSAVEERIPEDDNRPRAVCLHCQHIHYSNPKIVVGCLLTYQTKVLLCQRDIEPRNNFWTLPAGYMENRETTSEGALREAKEEACAVGENIRLFAVYDLPRISHVYLLYKGILADGYANAGDETKAVALLTEQNIPWGQMAFPVMTEALQRHFEDQHLGKNRVHRAIFHGHPSGEPTIIREADL